MEIDLYKQKEYRLVDTSDIKHLTTKLGSSLGYNPAQIALIIEIMIDDEWTIERASDAIKHVMKENKYATTSLAPGLVLGFNKDLRFYTYNQVIEKGILSDCEAVKVEGKANVINGNEKPYWAERNKHPFKLWNDYLAEIGEEVV